MCAVLGVPGLSDTPIGAQQHATTVAPELLTRTRISYRIAPDKRTVVPMANNVLAALERASTRPL